MRNSAIRFRDFARTGRGMLTIAVIIGVFVILFELTEITHPDKDRQATGKTVTVPLETYADDDCTGVKITQIKVGNDVIAKGGRNDNVDKPISVTVSGCERPDQELRIVNIATGKLFEQTSGPKTRQHTRKTVRTFTSPLMTNKNGWRGLTAYAGNETCYELIDKSFSKSGWQSGVDNDKVVNELANGRCETQALGAMFIGQ